MNYGNTESRCVAHEPCPACGSRDNLGRYDDGHGYCFGCGHYERAEGEAATRNDDLIWGEFRDLSKRGLREDTCRLYNYRVGRVKGRPVQIAGYYKDGEVVAQKVRFPDKDFLVAGDGRAIGKLLFGSHLCRDGGKVLVVTEGEIDAMSVSQVQGNKWPAVSVPTGAEGAERAIRANVEWLEKFDKVIFMFDNDPAGRGAAKECAEILTPGRAYIARLPRKDANDMLVNGEGAGIIDAIWGAKVYRPDGIIDGRDITFEDITTAIATGYETPYPHLDSYLHGIRKGELTLLTAGTGVGKSTLARELAYHFHEKHGLAIGLVFLEESYRKTVTGLVAIDNNVPLGQLRRDPSLIPEDKYRASIDKLVHSGRTYLYNHFGSLESENLLQKLRYFAVGLQVDFIFLDHISIAISGTESSREGERKDIDKLMTRLREMIEQTGVGIVAICHLTKSDGTPHEEGGRVRLDHLRGSGTLKQIPDNIVAIERDQQGDDPRLAQLRVLKNREFGEVGPCDEIRYDPKTGRMLPEGVFFDDLAENSF